MFHSRWGQSVLKTGPILWRNQESALAVALTHGFVFKKCCQEGRNSFLIHWIGSDSYSASLSHTWVSIHTQENLSQPGGITDHLQAAIKSLPPITSCSVSLITFGQPEHLSPAVLATGHSSDKSLLTADLCFSVGLELGLQRSPSSWGTSTLLPSGEENNFHEKFGARKSCACLEFGHQNFLQKVTFESLNMGGTLKEGCCLCLVQLEDM